MKKALLAAALALLTPALALAAFNDVSLSSGVGLTVNSLSLTVTGTTASVSTLVVNSGTLVVTLLPGSVVSISSTDKYTLAHDAESQYVAGSHCTDSESNVVFSYPASLSTTATTTITVTPSSTTCTASGSSSAGGGGIVQSSGGGGGGGGSAPIAAPTVPTQTQSTGVSSSGLTMAQIQTIITFLTSFGVEQSVIDNVKLSLGSATTGSSVSGGGFATALEAGMTHPDIKRLQQVLNSDPDTRVAASGSGSPGNETEYFGALTEAAVKKFQVKHGIAGPGDSGYGFVGPKTRAKLNSL